MESLKMAEQNQDDVQIESPQNLHEQALQFVESHRQVFEQYARGVITIEPSPQGLNTFAFNLEKNTIYIHPMFYKELGLSEERTVFATLHEIEHFLEKKQVLALEDGAERYKRYVEKIKKSRAFGLTDNCVADIYVNRSVVEKTNQEMGELEHGMYTEVLFKETDFTSAPKHIQFAQALLRESRVPDEKCIVDDVVREKLDYIQNKKSPKTGRYLIDAMTSPDTKVVDRWYLQDLHIMPIVEELKKLDIEEEKQKRQERNQDKQKQKEKEKSEEGQEQENQEGDNESGEKGEEGQELEQGQGQESGEGEQEEGENSESGNTSEKELESLDFDPNEIWKDEYNKAEQATPNAISEEEIEKAIEEYEKFKKEHVKSDKEIQEELDQEYADKLGVDKKELQQYRDTVKKLEQVINPETGRTVIEELRDIIRRIISKRKNKKFTPQYPVEEGDYLIEPAELVASVRAGNLHPKVWEVHELKDREDTKFGEVEISFVCDRSGSMDGRKLVEQRKAMVLAMEALKELSDISKKERTSMNNPLEVKHEVYTFQSDNEDDRKPIKVMSTESTETERIKTASKLSSCGGGTTDFVPLETIEGTIDEKTKKKIKEGELKKIVFVMTDGESNDSSRVQRVLAKMRQDGIIVIGIGITKEGESALTTYAPTASLAETAEKLPIVLGDLLKEHLSEV